MDYDARRYFAEYFTQDPSFWCVLELFWMLKNGLEYYHFDDEIISMEEPNECIY